MRWVAPLLRLGIMQDLQLRCIAPPPRSVCLVGISESQQVLGMVEVSSRYLDPWSTQPLLTLYISNLAVARSCRRHGIGTQLLRACEPIAQSWGFQELYLHVKDENQAARGLYRKLGYRLHRLELPIWAALLGHSQHLLLRKPLQ
jgi:ribosomal protein S18 acetylase RimI-like enzyme